MKQSDTGKISDIDRKCLPDHENNVNVQDTDPLKSPEKDSALEEKLFIFWLSMLPELGRGVYENLFLLFGSAKNIYYERNNEEKWKQYNGKINDDFMHEVRKPVELAKLKEMYGAMKKRGIMLVSGNDKCFPNKLREIPDPPLWLFVKGSLPDPQKPCVSIIGARNCTAYGEQAALYFAGELAKCGVQIISGLARGIDGESHRGAVNNGGRTFGILGNGVDVVFPASNRRLYEEVIRCGGVISEYPPGMEGLAYHFPQRNRLISGLSDVIFVIEAGEKSGTLITVNCGLEQGKTILALPGKITDKLSVGCNRLIREGAVPVTCTEDIIFELKSSYPHLCGNTSESIKKDKALAYKEKIVYSCLSLEPKHVETIASETKTGITDTIATLTRLELRGFVLQKQKDWYIRVGADPAIEKFVPYVKIRDRAPEQPEK